MSARDQDPFHPAPQTQFPRYPQVDHFRQNVLDGTAATDTTRRKESTKIFLGILPRTESGVANLAPR